MSNANFCSVTPSETIEKFEKYPHLKELFPNLYRQIISQTDGMCTAYPQTFVLDSKAASEFDELEKCKDTLTKGVIRDDYSFSGYIGSLCRSTDKTK